MCQIYYDDDDDDVNPFLQDDASAGIRSLQTSTEIKLCRNPWNGL